MSEGGGPVLSCLHHPIDKDQSLEELHDLPLNWYAIRASAGEQWKRFQHPLGEVEEDQKQDHPLLNWGSHD